MRHRAKKIALTALQIAITVGVLCWLLHDKSKRNQMGVALQQADIAWLALGIVVYGMVEVIASWRWDGLLRVQGIVLSRVRVFTLLLIGLFFNFFIPGGTGGDVVKIFYLMKEAPGRGAGAVLSVLMDRIIGLFALIIMAAVFLGVRWQWITSTPETANCAYTGLLILASSLIFIGFSFIVTGFGLVHRLPQRFPLREKLGELAMAYNLFGREWRVSLRALLTSFVTHTGYFFTFYCAARAFGAPTIVIPSFRDLCTIMPLINAITALPISFGGLGVRESLFQVFLNRLAGVDNSVGFLISSIGFLLTAFWGAMGGVLYLVYRPSSKIHLAAITEEVEAMEQTVAEEEMAYEATHDYRPRR